MPEYSLQRTHTSGACAFPRTVNKLEKAHIESSVAKQQLGGHLTAINNYIHSLKAGKKPSLQKMVMLLERLAPYSDAIIGERQRCLKVRSMLCEVLGYHTGLRSIDAKYIATIEKIESQFLGSKDLESMAELLRLNKIINDPSFKEEGYLDGHVSNRSKVLAMLPKDCIIVSVPWA